MSRKDELDPITPSEAAHAESFAKVVDRLLAGEHLPAAMDADDRALVETATVVVASHRELPLTADRTRALVDQALERGVLGRGLTAPEAAPRLAEVESAPAPVPIRPARRRLAAIAPWSVAAVCAAAAIVLFVSRPEPGAPAPAAPVAELPDELSSRPADGLVGQIPRAHAADASERADIIYADRLAGFRELSFRSGGEP